MLALGRFGGDRAGWNVEALDGLELDCRLHSSTAALLVTHARLSCRTSRTNNERTDRKEGQESHTAQCNATTNGAVGPIAVDSLSRTESSGSHGSSNGSVGASPITVHVANTESGGIVTTSHRAPSAVFCRAPPRGHRIGWRGSRHVCSLCGGRRNRHVRMAWR